MVDIEVTTEHDRTNIVLNKTRSNIKNIERDLADFFKSALQKQLVLKQKVDTAETLQSIKRIATKDGYGVAFSQILAIIDAGRGPTQGSGTGMVKKNIRKGLKRKGIDVSWASGKTKDDKLDNAAFVIARKIHKQGFKATPIIKPAQKELESNKMRIIKKS